ncbi:PREDICTED: uncharacterized protein LOC104789482 [Camelina sativa]|uniref:Uncharacterized protein LOC104789482 n=1 Tax=Camelina sativa TaxID=90675 RepID=A0ABM0ZBW4_CAMSA|nr:PREDICTED: uncharacterized protein LOC104789482 [Camelina sativa]
MPFGLKNAGATYQRLVNKMFAEQLGRTMEVYIDDMLVKSQRASDHITHLRQCFDTLNKYGMKLNPAKCTFVVKSGEFLGYLVTRRGIEANPKQIKATIDLPLPRNAREVANQVEEINARYPQGNGQAEATIKTILDGLKKRLDAKKGAWADELDGVLWSYRTTPRQATNQTPFSLAYGMEAMAPAQVGSTSLRRTMLVQDTALKNQMLLDRLDELEEEHYKALMRIHNYQLAAAKYYNKKVHN